MRVTETRCDRCEGKIPHTPATIRDRYGNVIDLCEKCIKSFGRFMENQDEVGEYEWVLVPGPCPHHVPCADPGGCTQVWERQKRK